MNAWCVKWGIELNVRNVFRRRLREEITISIPDWSRQAIHGDNDEDYTLYFKESWIDVRKIFLDSWDFIWRLLNQLEARAHWNCNTHLKKLFRFRELNSLESLKLWNPAWIYIYIIYSLRINDDATATNILCDICFVGNLLPPIKQPESTAQMLHRLENFNMN